MKLKSQHQSLLCGKVDVDGVVIDVIISEIVVFILLLVVSAAVVLCVTEDEAMSADPRVVIDKPIPTPNT